jgi:hypothetical protein
VRFSSFNSYLVSTYLYAPVNSTLSTSMYLTRLIRKYCSSYTTTPGKREVRANEIRVKRVNSHPLDPIKNCSAAQSGAAKFEFRGCVRRNHSRNTQHSEVRQSAGVQRASFLPLAVLDRGGELVTRPPRSANWGGVVTPDATLPLQVSKREFVYELRSMSTMAPATKHRLESTEARSFTLRSMRQTKTDRKGEK